MFMSDIDAILQKMQTILAKKRAEYFDPERPTNLLTEVIPANLEAVAKQWELPKDYLYFLSKYSPVGVEWDNDNYFALDICEAKDLINIQAGYSYNALTNEINDDWPHGYLVIAVSNGDPYCIDLGMTNSPILTAMHGVGKWDFYKDSDSFKDFLKKIVVE